MNATDRAEFIKALAGLDNTVNEITAAATDDDSPTALLVAQVGTVTKAVSLLLNFIIESRSALRAALAAEAAPAATWQRYGPGPGECVFCSEPASPELPTYDWPMCESCFNAVGAFDPVLDGAALEIAESLTQ